MIWTEVSNTYAAQKKPQKIGLGRGNHELDESSWKSAGTAKVLNKHH